MKHALSMIGIKIKLLIKRNAKITENQVFTTVLLTSHFPEMESFVKVYFRFL